MSTARGEGAVGDATPGAVADGLAFVVGEIDAGGNGVRPLAAFRSREAAVSWAAAWRRGEVAAGRLAAGHDTTEIDAVPLDPVVPEAVPVERRHYRPGLVDTGPPRTDRIDLLDEDALPLDGLTAPERVAALERLAVDVLGEHAAAWWGTPSPDTWDTAPRALLSSDVGARRVRTVLLSTWRGILGIFA